MELSFSPPECGLGLASHFQGIEYAKGGIVALLVEKPGRYHTGQMFKFNSTGGKAY